MLVLRFYDDVKVPKDANFSIQTSSVMGGRFVKVVGGHQDRGYLREGMTVQGQLRRGLMQQWTKWINSWLLRR